MIEARVPAATPAKHFGRSDTVNHTTNWKPDPYGIHEFRYFSADGKPTLLVMDGGTTSYDKPPSGELPLITDPQQFAPDAQSVVPAPIPAPTGIEPPKAPGSIEQTTPLAVREPVTGKSQVQVAVPSVSGVVSGDPTSQVDYHETEPMARPLKIAFGIVLGVMAVSALGFLYVHIHHHAAPGGRTHENAAATTTIPTHPTTTVVLPSALKPSAETAAAALISSWSTSNRPGALTVATSAAVATLFAATYDSGLAIDRGCSTAFVPVVCTFGPPGGASPTDPIYQIFVSQSSGGWYVSSVKIEN